MQGRLQQIQDELQQQTVTGAVRRRHGHGRGGRQGQIRQIKIDPSVVNPADVEMLEDLVLVAVAEAQKKARELAQEEMGKLTGGMNLPFKLPF